MSLKIIGNSNNITTNNKLGFRLRSTQNDNTVDSK